MGTSDDWGSSAQLTDRALRAEVSRKARCADGTLDPDEWFPVSTEAEAARREAAGAIAICRACPVRGACLELALRHWAIGQHGVWGGLVAAERAALRRRGLASAHKYGRVLSMVDRIWDGPPQRVTPGERAGPLLRPLPRAAPCPHASREEGPRDARAPDSGATARDQADRVAAVPGSPAGHPGKR
jgi:WhiB family transcriptional regulator, redox-sensing transcriptional regulator